MNNAISNMSEIGNQHQQKISGSRKLLRRMASLALWSRDEHGCNVFEGAIIKVVSEN
jgi:hypothetical protein